MTPDQLCLAPELHFFITTQGKATIEGTALEEDDPQSQARPTQAVWGTATGVTDITVDQEWALAAIQYTPWTVPLANPPMTTRRQNGPLRSTC